MRNFNLGALEAWVPLDLGEVFEIPGPVERNRVRFQLLADKPVACYVHLDDGDRRLVAAGDGLLRVSFSGEGALGLEVVAEDGAEVFVQRRTEPQVLPESDVASFTTIEPRGVGPSSDLARMMMIVRINEQRRNEQVRLEIERLEREGQSYRSALKADMEAVQAAKAEAGATDPA